MMNRDFRPNSNLVSTLKFDQIEKCQENRLIFDSRLFKLFSGTHNHLQVTHYMNLYYEIATNATRTVDSTLSSYVVKKEKSSFSCVVDQTTGIRYHIKANLDCE